MFGLFKKEMGWEDVEFVFIASAAEMNKRLSSAMSADSILGKINETLRLGKIKLSPSQERAVTSACAVMALSSELRNSLKKITNNDGSINEFEFSKLVKELPSHGIFFRDTPTMSDIHKSIFGN
ncbi:hypothetical protein [Polynucleobacter sp. AP-Reno-20A-A9]|uniref:hypothetical protein n=1 Tax=Polynucleobacter sp. AP-Reno-20A-A9 TaxID=2576925 RepID=UPI001C0BBCDD|nr:hypothetical protein [Polynucleobacter sp. AP-Reno-20A-A9]MBU3627999.1 hypothetical protein [Polynucleobacter sp. AP-Reno-20A-A9]